MSTTLDSFSIDDSCSSSEQEEPVIVRIDPPHRVNEKNEPHGRVSVLYDNNDKFQGSMAGGYREGRG